MMKITGLDKLEGNAQQLGNLVVRAICPFWPARFTITISKLALQDEYYSGYLAESVIHKVSEHVRGNGFVIEKIDFRETPMSIIILFSGSARTKLETEG